MPCNTPKTNTRPCCKPLPYVLQGLSVSLIPSDPAASQRVLCQAAVSCVDPSHGRHDLGAHPKGAAPGGTSDSGKAHGGGGGLPGFGKSLLNAALSIGRHGPGQLVPGSRSGPTVDRHATLVDLVTVKEGEEVGHRQRGGWGVHDLLLQRWSAF
jgi:hypothetical protein